MVPALEGGIVLPYGVVHPGYREEGGEIGCVGGAHDESEKPPAAHHYAHGHRVHGGFATCGRETDKVDWSWASTLTPIPTEVLQT